MFGRAVKLKRKVFNSSNRAVSLASLSILILLVATLCTSSVISVKATSTTIRVPQHYSTIQGAINAANPGDTIQVAAGIYSEWVCVNKTLCLIGEGGNRTIITDQIMGIEIKAGGVHVYGFTIQNAGFGISVLNFSDIVLVNNTLYNNYLGLFLFGELENRTIYHNNFINNTYQIYQNIFEDPASLCTWDNGEEGNYWSDYNGSDLNGDGVGDTFLPAPDGYVDGYFDPFEPMVDYYPLMEPYVGITGPQPPTPPTADFTYAPDAPYVNETVTFDASSSLSGWNGAQESPIVSYEWKFGDGATATGVNVTHSYAGDGNHTVELNVTDSQGLSDITSKTVPVSLPPPPPPPHGPTAKFSYSPAIPEVNETVAFDASSSLPGWDGAQESPIVSYAWDFGDGTTSTGVNSTHAYVSDGNYLVTLNVTDNQELWNVTSKYIPVALPPTRHGDVNRDNQVDVWDLYLFARSWYKNIGDEGYNPNANFGGSSRVDGSDLFLFAKNWYEGVPKPEEPPTVTPGYATVSIYPSLVEGSGGGSTFTVDIKIENVTDLYAWSIGLGWDPTVLNCIGVTFNYSFLPLDHNLQMPGTINNSIGELYPPYARSLTTVSGVTGSGTLLHVEFSSLYGGSTWLNFTQLTLINSDGESIPFNLVNSYFSLLPPEPHGPTARFNYSPAAPRVNEAVTFDASNSSPRWDGENIRPIVSYSWDFGDGNITAVADPVITHSYTAVGDYTVILNVTTDQGFWNTTSKTITVSPQQTTIYVCPSIIMGEVGDTFKIYINIMGVEDLYTWAIGVSWNSSFLECLSYTHNFSFFGPQEELILVHETVNDSYQACGASLSKEVPGLTRSGTLAQLEFRVLSGGSTSINLIIDALLTHLGENIPHQVVNGYFSARAPPTARFGYSPAAPKVNETVNFDASNSSLGWDGTAPTSIVSYSWDFGDRATGTGMTPTHTYPAKGTYTVTLTVTDSQGFSDTTSKTITVLSQQSTIFVHLSYIVGEVGDTFKVYINIEDVTDLYAWGISLSWNSSVLECLSFTYDYSFFGPEDDVLTVEGTINNTAGEIQEYNASFSHHGPGVTGSGTLAQLEFRVLSNGSTFINLMVDRLLDSSELDIPYTVVNGYFANPLVGLLGDIDEDGFVGGVDLFYLGRSWYQTVDDPHYDGTPDTLGGYDYRADFDNSGRVDGGDLYWLAKNWYQGVP